MATNCIYGFLRISHFRKIVSYLVTLKLLLEGAWELWNVFVIWLQFCWTFDLIFPLTIYFLVCSYILEMCQHYPRNFIDSIQSSVFSLNFYKLKKSSIKKNLIKMSSNFEITRMFLKSLENHKSLTRCGLCYLFNWTNYCMLFLKTVGILAMLLEKYVKPASNFRHFVLCTQK